MGQVPGRRRERRADVLPDLAELELMPDRRVGALPKASVLFGNTFLLNTINKQKFSASSR